MILRRENKGCQTYTAWFIFFLLSLFYISTTTRHTLENRRFLEANSNEKFCGTIRETLCECAAPSSMESYIYNIACSCVFHICCVYVSVCISMCLHVYGCVICACLRVLRYSLSLFLSYLLSYFLTLFTRVLSLFSFSRFFSPVLSHSFRRMYTHTRSFRPPFSPSLSYFLTFRVRSPLSMYWYFDSRISTELNLTRSKETTRDRTKIVIVSRSIPRLELVVDSFYPPLRPLARSLLSSFFSHLFH